MKSVAFRSSIQALPVRTHVSRNMNTCAIRAQPSAPVLVKSDGTRYTIEKVRTKSTILISISLQSCTNFNKFVFNHVNFPSGGGARQQLLC